MFIRVKNINGSPYAYLVQNEWTQHGSRQKSTTYLGRVEKVGVVLAEFEPPHGSAEDILLSLVGRTLAQAGFEQRNKLFCRDEVSVDLIHFNVYRKERPAVLELNEGFMCNLTLKNLFLFKDSDYSDDLQKKGLHPGRVLAQRIVEVGLQLSPEQFILTFEHLVPNSDRLLQSMYG